jgi:lipopolysaccharide/colanic/teichoic acid biosynthesis glycosyltransferase
MSGEAMMNRRLRYAILSADLFWIAGVFVMAQILLSGPSAGAAGISKLVHLPPILAAISLWVGLYFSKKLDCFRRSWHLPSICAQVTVAVCYLMVSLLVLALGAHYKYSRLALPFIAGLLSLGFVSIRGLALRLVASRSAASIKRRVVILGAGRVARELAHKIAHHPEMSMEVVGLLFPSGADPAGGSTACAAGSISLRSLNIESLFRENNIQELIIVEPVLAGPETEKLISKCRKSGMRIHLVPQHYELYLSKAELTEIEDVPLLSVDECRLPVLGTRVKRGIDVMGAVLLLVLSAPLLAVSAAALYAMKGKGFRKELRCGKNGVPFWMNRLNVERDAKRLPGYARILTKLSVTELPQLWNVLKGEMSLVGPRPESRDRVRLYSDWQRQRLTVIPGLTGLAQVRGLREEHSSQEKARFDLQYIGRWSLFLDLSLLLQTAWALFARLVKVDSFKVVPTLHSKLAREFVSRRMIHADSTQSGAD